MAKIEFALEGPPREVDDAAVAALDEALTAAAGGGEIMHAVDPRRLLRWEHGGPPVWSVAFGTVRAPAPTGTYQLHLTYGLSSAIDPSSPYDFELSFATPVKDGGLWAAMLLRGLARYMRKSGRELKEGELFPLFKPISRAMLSPEEAETAPSTRISNVALAGEPVLRAPFDVRRVVGLYDDEVQLQEIWTTPGFLALLQERDPQLVTALGRSSIASSLHVVQAVEAGSAREGSSTGAIPLRGTSWRRDKGGYEVTLPGASSARRLLRLLRARLPHGRPLLVENPDEPGGPSIGFSSRPEPMVNEPGDNILEIGGPPDVLYEVLEDKIDETVIVLNFTP